MSVTSSLLFFFFFFFNDTATTEIYTLSLHDALPIARRPGGVAVTAPRDWDAATYSRLAAPMTAMGLEVLDRLELTGDETVLDAGCGTGNVTRALYERLPRGRVVAVDAAPSMVEQARAALPADVDVRRADLLELVLDEPVDAVLSTATFHWIGDHERLFATLFHALAPGGRLVEIGRAHV